VAAGMAAGDQRIEPLHLPMRRQAIVFRRSTMKLKGGFIMIAAILLAGLFPCGPAGAREAKTPAVGFVAGIQGSGYIVRNRDTIKISGMDLLYRDDTVRLTKGAKARISICGGRGYEVRGEAAFIMGRTGIQFKRGKQSKTYAVDRKACAAALEVFGKSDARLPEMVTGDRKGTLILRSRKKSERRGVYVVRSRKQVPVIEILNDKLVPQKPVLYWTPAAGSSSYRIVIKSGDEVIWSSTVMKNRCEYPESAPRLAEGRGYDAAVEAVDDKGDVLARGGSAFSLFSGKEIESLGRDESAIRDMTPADSPEQLILLGRLHEAHGQFAEALSCYEKALSLDGGNDGLRERIALMKKNME